ncbi:MAG: hypothetical protein ACRENK_04855 [Gemmatimonadaceae bacterium]
MPKKFPARIPTMISIRATDTPILIEMILAMRASPIQMLAMSQTFNSIYPSAVDDP